MKVNTSKTVKIANKNDSWSAELTFDVKESGAFDYGNHTMTVISCARWETPQLYDTRYYRGTLDDFIKEFVESFYGKDYSIV